MAKSEIAPHACPACEAPCYQGAFKVECTNPRCAHHHQETAAAYRREQFPSASTIIDEDEPTQPQAIPVVSDVHQPTRWPSTPPAAIFPDDEKELAQQIRDGVDEAIASGCTPEEAEALRQWRDEILKSYLDTFGVNQPLRDVKAGDVVAFMEKALGDGWHAMEWQATVDSRTRRMDLDVKFTYTKPITVTPINVEIDLEPAKDEIAAAAQVPRKALFLDDEAQVKFDRAVKEHTAKALEIDYARFERLLAANRIPTATGDELDRWAELFGLAKDPPDLLVCRAPGETDEELRKRLRERFGWWNPGGSL